jgi:DNA-binding LacI/PurR family transcriptional regulator
VVPQLGAASNTFTGALSASSFSIGNNLFGYGSFSSQNAFLGFSGSTTATGLLDAFPRLKAFFAVSATATGGAIEAIQRRGLGHAITLVGCDDDFFLTGDLRAARRHFVPLPRPGTYRVAGFECRGQHK